VLHAISELLSSSILISVTNYLKKSNLIIYYKLEELDTIIEPSLLPEDSLLLSGDNLRQKIKSECDVNTLFFKFH
jgi:hypothetical protein